MNQILETFKTFKKHLQHKNCKFQAEQSEKLPEKTPGWNMK